MKSNSRMNLLILAIGFILVTNVITKHSFSVDPLTVETEIQRSETMPNFFQEQPKYQYVGAEKCATVCHNDEKIGFQYNIWKSSPHANAFNILASKRAVKFAKKARIEEDPQNSQTCLNCHITGSVPDSIFSFASTYKKEEGVTCEACHKQKTAGKTYLPDEADCLKCHEDSIHKMSKFDFTERCTKIAHPRPAELSLKIQ